MGAASATETSTTFYTNGCADVAVMNGSKWNQDDTHPKDLDFTLNH